MAEWHDDIAAAVTLELGVVLGQALPGVENGGTPEGSRFVESGRGTQHCDHPNLSLVRAIRTLHLQDSRVDLWK